MTAQVPPYDGEAEVGLLGAMLLAGAPIEEIRAEVGTSEFYRPAHQHTFAIICSLHDHGESVDPLTVNNELRRQKLNGLSTSELIEAQTQAVGPKGAVAYGRIVHERALDRHALAVAAEITHAAQEGRLPSVLPTAVQRLGELGVVGDGDDLVVEDIAAMSSRATSLVTRFLCRPVWPGDAYGVLAAEKKVGKTWLALDLAVSVAAGGSWLTAYPVDSPGPVLLFLGEGGERKMLRRLTAICEAKGVCMEDLPIRLCCKAPQLSSPAHLGLVRQEVTRNSPVLVVVDPLYLSAAGAKSTDLYAMGHLLAGIQSICQQAGAALVIVTHWNKTGEGHGSHRMTGAGPAEWGRVLVSVGIEDRSSRPDRSTVATLRITFEGDEIPETELRLRRRVWTDDPDDLGSALHYDVQLLAHSGVQPGKNFAPAVCRVLAVLEGADDWLDVTQIGDRVATDDSGFAPLKKRTIQDACKVLKDAGVARATGTGNEPYKWHAQQLEMEAENAF